MTKKTTDQVCLADFRENPDNPSKATEEQLDRLAEKLKRIPLGLTAIRIAYVTDAPGGGKMVISGNKRLRVLKMAYGSTAKVPAAWFVDVTAMTPEQRHEFIVDANTTDGEWDLDKLLEQYDRQELADLMGAEAVDDLLADLEAEKPSEAENAEYDAFVDKFRPKLTTDDCYTPENVFAVVQEWAVNRYGLQGVELVRPFYPGGDYEHFDYPPNCCVLDNPPFSILAEIVKFYQERKIRFFLYGPGLTIFSGAKYGAHYVICGASIIYHNGAVVRTGFITNMGENLIEVVPELKKLIEAEVDKNKDTKELPKYEYPMCVATAARLEYLALRHTPFAIKAKDAKFIRKLDAQGDNGIFGGAWLLSERAAAERAAAERAAAERAAAERAAAEQGRIVWKLSKREIAIQRSLG
ncbi:MAG: hypothetical protein ACI4Q3_00525 [Kiritimatiellia bacterium]